MSLYVPWMRLMLFVGLPLVVLGTLAMFPFERRSVARQLLRQLTLFGWGLVVVSVAFYFILRALGDALTTLPVM